MERKTDKYSEFVEHPRYGRGPRITGLNPLPDDPGVFLHWHSKTLAEAAEQHLAATGTSLPHRFPRDVYVLERIANTAILAKASRQNYTVVPVTHYFDVARACRDCKRKFIFFAAEQKHWYEKLGFGLDSDCVHCVDCRKTNQGIAKQRARYETLYHIEPRTTEQNLEMADACLSLIEADVFPGRKTEFVRMLLNSMPENLNKQRPTIASLIQRTHDAENK